MRFDVTTKGERIDAFLSKNTDLSRSRIQSLIEENRVLVCGRVEKKRYILKEGDVVEVDIPEATELEVEAHDIPLDIVYSDDDIIVVNKEKGMVVHPAAGHSDDTLVNALLYHCKDGLSGINGCLRPGIVHRIDKDTSGLIVVAKNDKAHMSLTSQLKDHSMYREYHTVVKGRLKECEGRIDAPIGRDIKNRKKMAVTDKNSKEAVTNYTVLAEYSGYSYVQCRLETGRTHQIRVHMAHVGHPVLGDTLYGGSVKGFVLDGQCLHAKKLTLRHPTTGEIMTFECDLPDYFKNVLNKLEKV